MADPERLRMLTEGGVGSAAIRAPIHSCDVDENGNNSPMPEDTIGDVNGMGEFLNVVGSRNTVRADAGESESLPSQKLSV